MNPIRLVVAIIAVFVGIAATDFLIHQVWLADTYAATKSLWRPEGDMEKHMGWIMGGEFLAAVTFVTLWARGFASPACPTRATIYGLIVGLLVQTNTIMMFAVQPLPASLAIKWFVAGVVQSILMGLLVWAVYKPKPAPANPS